MTTRATDGTPCVTYGIYLWAKETFDPDKTTLYRYVEEGKFSNASTFLKELKENPNLLRVELFEPCRNKNPVHLVLSKPATEKSKEFLDQVFESIDAAPKECGGPFARMKPFAYALENGQEGLFCHMLEKHPSHLDREQIEKCLAIIANGSYYTAGEHLLKHLKAQEHDESQALILGDGNLTTPFMKAVRMVQRDQEGSLEVLKLFMSAVSFQAVRFADGKTIFHVLAEQKAGVPIALLTSVKSSEVKALIDEKDDTGKTALHIAALKNHRIVINALLMAGADFTMTYEGKTPLELTRGPICCVTPAAYEKLWRAEHGLFEVNANIQSEMKKKINIRREDGFILSCVQGNLAALRELVEDYKVDVNTLDGDRNNALMMILESTNKSEEEILPFVRFFIEQEINLSHQNRENENALMFAARRGFKQVCELILDADKKVALNHKNKEGLTAIDMAKGEGHTALAKSLKRNYGE